MSIDLKNIIPKENGEFVIDKAYLRGQVKNQFWRCTREIIQESKRLFGEEETLKIMKEKEFLKRSGYNLYNNVLVALEELDKEIVKEEVRGKGLFDNLNIDNLPSECKKNKEKFDMLLSVLDDEGKKKEIKLKVFQSLVPTYFSSIKKNFGMVKEIFSEKADEFKRLVSGLVGDRLERISSNLSDALRVGRGSSFSGIIKDLEFIESFMPDHPGVKKFINRNKSKLSDCVKRRTCIIRYKMQETKRTYVKQDLPFDERVVKVLLKYIPEDERKNLEKEFLLTVI